MDLARRAAFLLLGCMILRRTHGSLADMELQKVQTLDFVESDGVPLGARAVSTAREGIEGSLLDSEGNRIISPEYDREYDHRMLQGDSSFVRSS